MNAVNVMKGTGLSQEEKPVERPGANPFQGASPFLAAGTVIKKQESLLEKESAEKEKEPVFQQAMELPKESPKQSSLDKKKISFIIVGVVAVISLSIAGVWYFLRPEGEEKVISTPPEENPAPPAPQAVSVVMLPFAPDVPNYLPLDTETVTAQSLSVMLSEAGTKIRAANMEQPVEFFLTDKNNNPLAFSRFAYLMNIEFGEELLASFGEPFSLFLYNDEGKIRVGLALTFVDIAKSEKLLMAKEKSLPYFFREVLFQGTTLPREVTFRSGVYMDQPVRFVNIDTVQETSFDYAFREKNWFIGTSKTMLRAMLDK